MKNEESTQFTLPKNIRQIGTFGSTYKIYVEDFVYTYVHQFLHRKTREGEVISAVLLGKSIVKEDQEYIFISGAQKVDFTAVEADTDPEESAGQEGAAGAALDDAKTGSGEGTDPVTDAITNRQQDFWNRVYQGIKEYFDEQEILGWYFNLDGGGLQITSELQQFFESTYKKGSRFLYFEDRVEKEDAFFVQEQHKLQRLSGYAVYYEKNPAMQDYMIAEKERSVAVPLRERYTVDTDYEDVARNYRAIMNKLNDRPERRKGRAALYVAGVAVLAVVAATGITQIGSYQNLKVLQQTMQTLSGAVSGNDKSDSGVSSVPDETAAVGKPSVTETDPDTQPAADENIISDSASDNGGDDAAAMTQTPTSDSASNSVSDAADPISDTVPDPVPNTDAADPDLASGDDATTGGSDSTSGNASNVSTETQQSTKSAEQEEQSVAADSTISPGNGSGQTALPNVYVVKKGDSLVSISKSLYNTTDRIADICELNHIEDQDLIYEGQKLLLPK